MLLTKEQLMVSKAASTDQTRYSITGIQINPDGRTVATDGHMFFEYTPADTPMDDCEFPAVGNVFPTLDELVPFILAAKDAQAAVKAMPKSKRLPILSRLLLDVASTNENGSARMVTTDLDQVKVMEFKKIDATFPDCSKLIDYTPPLVSVALGVAVLRKALDTLEGMGVKHIVLNIRAEETDTPGPVECLGPIEVIAKTDEGHVTGLIMPEKLS